MSPALAGGFLTTVPPGKSEITTLLALFHLVLCSDTAPIYLLVDCAFTFISLSALYLISPAGLKRGAVGSTFYPLNLLSPLVLYFFFFFWLHWVFVAVRGLSLIAARRGYSSLRCAGFSWQWLLLLRSTGSRHTGFSSVAQGLNSRGSWALERRLSSRGTWA